MASARVNVMRPSDWREVTKFGETGTDLCAQAQESGKVEAQIDDMREPAVRINDLKPERIENIERDVGAFEADVAALGQAIARKSAAPGAIPTHSFSCDFTYDLFLGTIRKRL
jgi:hypothetical protein